MGTYSLDNIHYSPQYDGSGRHNKKYEMTADGLGIIGTTEKIEKPNGATLKFCFKPTDSRFQPCSSKTMKELKAKIAGQLP